MLHLGDITWAQTTLIEIGVLLQLIAVGTFMKDRPHYQPTLSSKEEASHLQPQAENQIFDLPETALPDGALRAEMNKQERCTPISAGSLTRTAKVRFVQSFKFRS